MKLQRRETTCRLNIQWVNRTFGFIKYSFLKYHACYNPEYTFRVSFDACDDFIADLQIYELTKYLGQVIFTCVGSMYLPVCKHRRYFVSFGEERRRFRIACVVSLSRLARNRRDLDSLERERERETLASARLSKLLLTRDSTYIIQWALLFRRE